MLERSALRAAALALLLTGCAGGRQAPSPVPSPTQSATSSPASTYHFIGRGTATQPVKLVDLVAGQPVYVLKSTDVVYSTNIAKGVFRDDAIYFYRQGRVRLHLVAPVANVDMKTYDFVLSGGVHAVSAQGIILDCDTLRYSGRTQLLTASGHVRATDAQGDVLTGDKAVADLDLQQIHMTGDVGIGR
ncbi:MAG TPA: LPS export ABC transporter periplasmic protein LptC [Candidatus Eremiobacteraceae bacterium]|nr:LPS export ABC transporter periplasmic protein LptC [Candidatus Eremiobacteraceae bacterium]